MKVARGRSWQPEIGMEHASRGRRSGNKGVGARWRGRFRIFSARHCSRTKVSHAENSGMTMLFFSLEVAPMSEGDSFTGSPPANTCSRNSHQNKTQSPIVIPEFSGAATAVTENIRNLRRKAGLPSHRSSGGILSHARPRRACERIPQIKNPSCRHSVAAVNNQN